MNTTFGSIFTQVRKAHDYFVDILGKYNLPGPDNIFIDVEEGVNFIWIKDKEYTIEAICKDNIVRVYINLFEESKKIYAEYENQYHFRFPLTDLN